MYTRCSHGDKKLLNDVHKIIYNFLQSFLLQFNQNKKARKKKIKMENLNTNYGYFTCIKTFDGMPLFSRTCPGAKPVLD